MGPKMSTKLGEHISSLMDECVIKESHNDLLSSIMDNFHAINDNGQLIRSAICKEGDGGESITASEIELIENSFAVAVSKLFQSINCVADRCSVINWDKIIAHISKKIASGGV